MAKATNTKTHKPSELPETAATSHLSDDGACEIMRRAGFPEAVRLEWLRRIVEQGEDDLLHKAPGRVQTGIAALRDLSADFDFRDSFLTPGKLEAIPSSRGPFAMSIPALRYALAYGEPAEKRLPLIALRAYARASQFAEVLRHRAAARAVGADHVKVLEGALQPLFAAPDDFSGTWAPRHRSLKGTPFGEIKKYCLWDICNDEKQRSLVEERFSLIEEGLREIQVTIDFIQAQTRKDGKTRNQVKTFAIVRLAEIFTLISGYPAPIHADYGKANDWPEFINGCADMFGITGERGYRIVNDLRSACTNDFKYLSDQSRRLKGPAETLEAIETLEKLCDLPTALDLLDEGLEPEPVS